MERRNGGSPRGRRAEQEDDHHFLGLKEKFLVKARRNERIETVSSTSSSSSRVEMPKERQNTFKMFCENFKRGLEKKGSKAFLLERSESEESL